MTFSIVRLFIKSAIFLFLIVCTPSGYAQNMHRTKKEPLKIKQISNDFSAADLDNPAWKKASDVSVKTYWSGVEAPAGRHFTARLLWSKTALYVRFETNRSEPLIVSEKPELTKKTMGLWDRDVCEIFIAPNANEPRKYFEFEVAPTGEWIDLAIDLTSGKRETDWEYISKMESAAQIEKDKVVMAIKVPWKALGKMPKTGDVWRGNLFRCVGKDPDRGYLTWSPTMTKSPDFHVPERFGEFVFNK